MIGFLSDLMMTSYNISLYNDTQEGVVTLTAMLTTRYVFMSFQKKNYFQHIHSIPFLQGNITATN